jgi:RNA polymerase sigma-70 factor (ECF subfamily)
MLDGEENLIEKAQNGDSECFGKLYDHYLPKIYRFVLIKVNNREITEDLVHEVFMSAWQSIGRYRHKGFPFSSWLYQIARNQVIDHYRVKKNHANLDEIDEEKIKVDNALGEKLDNLFSWEKVQGAIKRLSHDQQDVLIMRFVEGLSHREIAASMKKSEGAVRIIQHRAINELKSILA